MKRDNSFSKQIVESHIHVTYHILMGQHIKTQNTVDLHHRLNLETEKALKK